MSEAAPARRTLIEICDAAYEVALDDEAWLALLLEAARPLLDLGSFVHGWTFRAPEATPRATVVLQHPASVSRGDATELVRTHLPPDPRTLSIPLGSVPRVMTAMEFFPTGDAASRAGIPAGFGLVDALGLSAIDTSGVACSLIGTSSTPIPLTEELRVGWGLVSAHVASAMRLRERLRAFPSEAPLDAADAIFDARGAVLHQTREVESQLDTVRDAARFFGQRHGGDDAERALELWQALVAGTWSFVETVDTDRKRFFVLRRNEPSTPGPPMLSVRERTIAALIAMGDSNKAIAYQLGLAESTISRDIAALCAKLGAPSREVLAEMLSAFVQSGP